MANKKIPFHVKQEAVARLDRGEDIDVVAASYGKKRRTLEGWRRDVNGPKVAEPKVRAKVLDMLEADPHIETSEVVKRTGASPSYVQQARREVLRVGPRPKSGSLVDELYEKRIPGMFRKYSHEVFQRP